MLGCGDLQAKSLGVCDYGRVHSVVTQTHRELRAAMRLAGERLAEIDISGSQPTLAGVQAAREQASKRRRQDRGASGEETRGRGGEREGRGPLSLTVCKTAPIYHACKMPSDLADYLVPVNADISGLRAVFLDGEDREADPIGVKGLGEVVFVGVAPAIANAVFNATGRRIRDGPVPFSRVRSTGAVMS